MPEEAALDPESWFTRDGPGPHELTGTNVSGTLFRFMPFPKLIRQSG
jgi:hypothetical protein